MASGSVRGKDKSIPCRIELAGPMIDIVYFTLHMCYIGCIDIEMFANSWINLHNWCTNLHSRLFWPLYTLYSRTLSSLSGFCLIVQLWLKTEMLEILELWIALNNSLVTVFISLNMYVLVTFLRAYPLTFSAVLAIYCSVSWFLSHYCYQSHYSSSGIVVVHRTTLNASCLFLM